MTANQPLFISRAGASRYAEALHAVRSGAPYRVLPKVRRNTDDGSVEQGFIVRVGRA